MVKEFRLDRLEVVEEFCSIAGSRQTLVERRLVAHLSAEDAKGRYETSIELTPDEYEMVSSVKSAIEQRARREISEFVPCRCAFSLSTSKQQE